MDKFSSTIQLAPMKENLSSDENNNESICSPESPQLRSYSSDSIGQISFANCDKRPIDVFEQNNVRNSEIRISGLANSMLRKTEQNGAGDFSGSRKRPRGFADTSLRKNDHIQGSSSYVNIVRNAVLGLARNCGKKRKSRSNKCAKSNWLPEVGVVKSCKDEQEEKGYESKFESEIRSESIRDKKTSNIPIEIPLRVQLETKMDTSPRKPITLLVRVPTTVFNLLNRKISDQDIEISSTEARANQGRRKKRLTSVFRKLLKGRKKTSSSTTVDSTKEKPSSHWTFASEKMGNDLEDQENDFDRATWIYTLRKRSSSEHFYESDDESLQECRNVERASIKSEFVPPTTRINGYENISLNSSPRVISYKTKPRNEIADGSARQKLGSDKAPRTEVMSNETEVVKGSINYHDEEIIPLRCCEGSPQMGNKHKEISQRDVAIFLKSTKEMREYQVYRDVNGKHIEIPVEIKNTESPLHLHKSENVSNNFVHDRFFHSEANARQVPPINDMETEQFLRMLVKTLREDTFFSQSEHDKSLELGASFSSAENKQQDDFQLLKNSEASALEVLLEHIATGSSDTISEKHLLTEKIATMQLAPKRQLSKLSVCYSSASLSGSEHETPEPGTTPAIDPNLNGIQARRTFESCNRTEIIIEEQTCSSVGTRALSIRDIGNTIFGRPDLSKQMFGNRKELADAMIRWWGPGINYSTTPSSQTHVSAYSVSINNFSQHRD